MASPYTRVLALELAELAINSERSRRNRALLADLMNGATIADVARAYRVRRGRARYIRDRAFATVRERVHLDEVRAQVTYSPLLPPHFLADLEARLEVMAEAAYAKWRLEIRAPISTVTR